MQSPPHQKKQTPFLKKVRQLLTCTLSGENFNKPVYISCGHVFNKISLETVLSNKDACPKCNTKNVWSTMKEDYDLAKISGLAKEDIEDETIITALVDHLQDIVLMQLYLFPAINNCGHTLEKSVIPVDEKFPTPDNVKECPQCKVKINKKSALPNYLMIALLGFLLNEKPELIKEQPKDCYLHSSQLLGLYEKGYKAVINQLAIFPHAINRLFSMKGEASPIGVQQFIIKTQQIEFLEALLKIPLFNNGSEHYVCDGINSSLLTLATAEPSNILFDYILALAHVDVNHKNIRGESALFIAAARGDTYKVKALIALHHIDLIAKDKLGITAQQIAIEKGHRVVAELLDPAAAQMRELVQKSDFVNIVKKITSSQDTQQIFENSISSLVKCLPAEENMLLAFLNRLFDEIIKAKTIDQKNFDNMLLFLLKLKNELINKPFLAGTAPLNYALLRNDQSLLFSRLLPLRDINVNLAMLCAKYNAAMTPLALAVEEGWVPHTLQMLCEAGAEPNNAMQRAIKKRNIEQVKILLPFVKGQTLYDAWQCSKAYGNPEITKLFEQPLIRFRMYLQCANYKQAAQDLLVIHDDYPQLYLEFSNNIAQFLSNGISRDKLMFLLGKELIPLAWKRNNKKLLMEYLARMPNIVNDVITEDGKTILHVVVEENDEDTLEKLFAINELVINKPIANPGRFADQSTAVHLACYQGVNGRVLEKLIKRGASAHASNAAGETALLIAAENGSAGKVLFLLAQPEVTLLRNAYDIAQQNPSNKEFMAIFTDRNYKLRMYLQEKNYKKIAELLLEIYAIEQQGVEKMWQYFAQFMLLNERSILIHQAVAIELLHLAWLNNNRAILLAVLKKFPELVNRPLIDSKTILHLTVEKNDVAMTSLILHTEGVEVNVSVNKVGHSENGCTALHFACAKKENEPKEEEEIRSLITEELLNRKADPEIKNAKGETALYVSARSGNVKTFIRLLNRPEIDIGVSVGGKSIPVIARENNHLNIAIIFKYFEITRNLLNKNNVVLVDLQLPESMDVDKIHANFPVLFTAYSPAIIKRTKFILKFCSQDAKSSDIKINFTVSFFLKQDRENNLKQLISMFPASQDLFVLQASVFASFEFFLRTLLTKAAKLEYIEWAKKQDFFCNQYENPKNVPESSPDFFKSIKNLFGTNSVIKDKLEAMYETIRQQTEALKPPVAKATFK
jgi:ankyrin repeat protein